MNEQAVSEWVALDRHIGQQLRSYRLASGVELGQLCQVLQVTPDLFDDWENGRVHIPPGHLLEVAQLLSCPLSGFYTGFAVRR